MHIGQAEVTPLVQFRTPLVVHTEQMHYRGVEIVNVDAFRCDAATEITRLALHDAWLHADAGHEEVEHAPSPDTSPP